MTNTPSGPTSEPSMCVAASLGTQGDVRLRTAAGEKTLEAGDLPGARAALTNWLHEQARQVGRPIDVRVEDPDAVSFMRVHPDARVHLISPDEWREPQPRTESRPQTTEEDATNAPRDPVGAADIPDTPSAPQPTGPEPTGAAEPTAAKSSGGTSAAEVVEVLTQLADPRPDVRDRADAVVDSWGDRADLVAAADLPADVLDALASNCAIPFVREGVASNPATGAATLADLALDSDAPVRAAVAANPNIWSQTMAQLAQDPEPVVRAALTTNPAGALFLGGGRTGRRRHGRVLFGAAVAALVLVGAVLVGVLGWNPLPGWAPSATAMTATAWNGMTLPVSSSDGPTTFGDTASGFAHTQVGAALAAANLSVRIDPYAGPESFSPTITEQTFGGDPQALLKATNRRYQQQAIKAGISDGSPIPTSTGTILGYRIADYSADGPTTVHLLVSAPDGQQLDFGIDVIWSQGDYRLVDPSRSTTFVRSTTQDSSGYTMW